LDYLKGLCNRRRWKCKYAHPQLPALQISPFASDSVCKVWLVTGCCKFGDECHFLHPQLQNGRPRRSSISSTGSNVVSDVDSEESSGFIHNPYGFAPAGSLESSSSQSSNSSPGSPDPTLKRALSILNRMTMQKFHSLSQQMMALVLSDSARLQDVIPLIVRKASKESLNSGMYARLCKMLVDATGKEQSSSIRTQVWQLIVDGVDNANLDKAKRLGFIQFLGDIFTEGLATEARITTMLDLLMEKMGTLDDQDEAEFFVELTCKLLTSAGQLLDTRWPRVIDFFLEQLQAVSATRSTRLQVLVLNVIELHKVHHWTKKSTVQQLPREQVVFKPMPPPSVQWLWSPQPPIAPCWQPMFQPAPCPCHPFRANVWPTFCY